MTGQRSKGSARNGVSVLCDFDGTITKIDTAEYILDHYADGDWKGVDRLLEQGKITIEECMKRQFEMISLSRASMTRELDGVVVPRNGFPLLLDHCWDGGHRLRITSAGLDFYIWHFLEVNGWDGLVEVVAPHVTDHGNGVYFRFPEKRNADARNFKEDEVLAERAAGRVVAYIGDGTSDLWAALSADVAFAVKGSKLDRLLNKEKRPHHSFTDFSEVVDRLAEL